MRTCFHSVGLPERPLLEVIELAADAGYAAIEINCETLPWAPPHLTPAADAGTRRAVVAAAAAHGLPIAALGAHVAMVSSDPAERAAARSFVAGCIDLAADLGAPVVHILSGPIDRGQDRETAWDWFRVAVQESTAHAAKRGVEPASRPSPGTSSTRSTTITGSTRSCPTCPSG
ncbi:MAG: TIM barrel protein [Geminicoccaceae bacterium]